MKRRNFLTGGAACFVFGASVAPDVASAQTIQSVQDQMIAQLRQQGYSRIQISRTWLGRTRIVASGKNMWREIIINPATGEILRDFWRELEDEREDDRGDSRVRDTRSSISDNDTTSDDDSSDDDHDDDDDRDDDDDDRDDDHDDSDDEDDGGGDDDDGDDD